MNFNPNAKFGDKYAFFGADDDPLFVVGKGAFSTVRLAIRRPAGDSESPSVDRYREEEQTRYAVKLVDKKKLSSIEIRCLRNEAHILKSMNHPNIVRCFDYFEDSSFCYIVLEYLEGGDLVHLIMQKDHFNEKLARDIVVKLLSALEHCHKKNIVHRSVDEAFFLCAFF